MGLNRGLALVGFMGAGKSSVGRLLAQRLSWPFVDSDEVIASRFGAIADLLAAGEASFRAIESKVVRSLCDGTTRVLATGGGAFVSEVNRGLLRAAYVTVYLNAPFEVLAGRVGVGNRPLWDDEVKARFDRRQPLYETAEWNVPTTDRTVNQVVDEILGRVHQ